MLSSSTPRPRRHTEAAKTKNSSPGFSDQTAVSLHPMWISRTRGTVVFTGEGHIQTLWYRGAGVHSWVGEHGAGLTVVAVLFDGAKDVPHSSYRTFGIVRLLI